MACVSCFQRGLPRVRPGGPGRNEGPCGGSTPMGGTGLTGGRQVGQQPGQLLFQLFVHGSLQSQNLSTSGTNGAQHGQAGNRPGGMMIGMIGMVSILYIWDSKGCPMHHMRRAYKWCAAITFLPSSQTKAASALPCPARNMPKRTPPGFAGSQRPSPPPGAPGRTRPRPSH